MNQTFYLTILFHISLAPTLAFESPLSSSRSHIVSMVVGFHRDNRRSPRCPSFVGAPLFLADTPPVESSMSDVPEILSKSEGASSQLSHIFALATIFKKLRAKVFIDRESHLPRSIPLKKKRWDGQRILRNLSEWCFEACDGDHSGSLTYDEVYAGVLLAHLHLARYAGIAALYPPSRNQVMEFCEKVDPKGKQAVGRTEFREIVKLTMAHLGSRIIIYYGFLVLLVPMIASRIVSRLRFIHSSAVENILALFFCLGVFPSAFAFVDRVLRTFLGKIGAGWERDTK